MNALRPEYGGDLRGTSQRHVECPAVLTRWLSRRDQHDPVDEPPDVEGAGQRIPVRPGWAVGWIRRPCVDMSVDDLTERAASHALLLTWPGLQAALDHEPAICLAPRLVCWSYQTLDARQSHRQPLTRPNGGRNVEEAKVSPTLVLLRIIDTLSATIASASIALALADLHGVVAYSSFASVTVLGGVVGGVLTFASRNILGRRLPARTTAATSSAMRVLLAVAFGTSLANAAPLIYVTGFLLSLTSVVLMSMFHSLASASSTGLLPRTSLLAASAVGGLLGAPLAGVVVAAQLRGPLLIFQGLSVAGTMVIALLFNREFGSSLPPQRGARGPRWRLFRPIAWRVPVITGLGFSLGSIAPGVLTDMWGPRIGGLAGAAYLTGALTGALLVRAVTNSRWQYTIDTLRSHRRWFLPTSIGSLLWVFMRGPVWVSLLATLAAGIILHLVQAGFEQAAAELGAAEESGPTIVVLHSIGGLATAASLTFMPRVIEAKGLIPAVLTVALVLALLAVGDAVLPRRASAAR